MPRPHISCACGPKLAILLSVLCIDLTTCYIRLRTYDTGNLFVCDILSVSVKLVLLLLGIYKFRFGHENIKRAQGIIGDHGHTEKSDLNKWITMVVYLLIGSVSFTNICILETRREGSAERVTQEGSYFAAASCIMGIFVWIFDPSVLQQLFYLQIFNSEIVEDSSNEDGSKGISRYKINALLLLQVTPALCINTAAAFILIASLTTCWGAPVQLVSVIIMYSFEGLCISACFFCWILCLPLRPVFGFASPLPEFSILFHGAIVLCCTVFCMRTSGILMFKILGISITHAVAFIVVTLASSIREFDPSENQLEDTNSDRADPEGWNFVVRIRKLTVIASSWRWKIAVRVPKDDQLKVVTAGPLWWWITTFFSLLIANGLMFYDTLGMRAKVFNRFVTALDNFRLENQCGEIFAQINQDNQCLKVIDQMNLSYQCSKSLQHFLPALSQFLNAIDKSGQAGQCAKPQDQFGLNNQSVGTYNLYGGNNQHLKASLAPVAKTLGSRILNNFTEKALDHFVKAFHQFDEDDPLVKAIDPFTKAFTQFRKDDQCVKALNQTFTSLNDIGQNYQCVKQVSEFANEFDKFVSVFNLFVTSYWACLAFVGILLVVPFIYILCGKILTLGGELELRCKHITFGKEILQNTWHPVRIVGNWFWRYSFQFPSYLG